MAMNQLRHSKFVHLALLTGSILLTGCAAQTSADAPASVCQAGDQMAQTTLYFGLSRPDGGYISQEQWQAFVDQEVTPRFRDGLTVFQAQGQWLGNDGKVAKEGSRALMLIHGQGDDLANKDIETLREIYKNKFAQESVMRVDGSKCVSF